MSPLADRRSAARYEVVGKLRGTLERSDTARVINISYVGALLETARALVVGAVQPVELTLDGPATRVSSRVRRLAAIGQPPKPVAYAIGVEFLSPPEALLAAIAHLADAQFD